MKFKKSTAVIIRGITFAEGETVTDYKAVITGLLSTVFKMDKAKIDEILADGKPTAEVSTAILDADKARVKAFKEAQEKEKFQEGFKKAKSEVLTEAEKAIKEKYGVESDRTGLELIEDVVAKASEGTGAAKKAKDLTPEDIRATETYLTMEKGFKKQLKEQGEAHTEAINKIQETHTKEKTFGTVAEDGLKTFNGLNPVLSQDATIAANQRQVFVSILAQYDYKELEDGTKVPMKDGKVLLDGHGHAITFDDHVKTIASSLYDFAANNEGENSGAGKTKEELAAEELAKKQAGAYPANVKKPTTQEELNTLIFNGDLSASDKRIVMETFNTEKGITVE